MDPWIEGCVPDSIRYVPGRGVVHVSAVVTPANTSVEKDRTRSGCTGGVKVVVVPTVDHVTTCEGCVGLGSFVADVPSPPPNWPTITNEVGTVFVLPLGVVNERLLVRLIVRLCPVGTVMMTGDQLPADTEGFKGAQFAFAATHVYPHMGTCEPSGKVAVLGPAVKPTVVCATAATAATRRSPMT
jgi:hypothetical protein